MHFSAQSTCLESLVWCHRCKSGSYTSAPCLRVVICCTSTSGGWARQTVSAVQVHVAVSHWYKVLPAELQVREDALLARRGPQLQAGATAAAAADSDDDDDLQPVETLSLDEVILVLPFPMEGLNETQHA